MCLYILLTLKPKSKFSIRPWTGLLIGTLLALVAPLGWLAISSFSNDFTNVQTEISRNYPIYLYLLISTEIVFASLGYALVALIQKLEGQALLDPLTQVPNRRFFDVALKKMISLGPTIMLLIDIDHFKDINDQLGHLTGDEALAKIGKIIKKNTRNNDICARYGGDEFALILSNQPKPPTLAEAYVVARRLLKELNSEIVQIHHNCAASIGIGMVDQEEDPTTLIEFADNALYAAKQAGGKTIKHLPDKPSVETTSVPRPIFD
jgi:diguanylate cyclase (GGDEF)-like protein